MTQIPEGKNETDRKIVLAKKQLEKLMLQFNELLQDKILPQNKSQGQLKAETDIVMRLLVAANELDALNNPEGLYSIMTLIMRQNLDIRDNYNKLEHKIESLKQELNKLRMQVTDASRSGSRKA